MAKDKTSVVFTGDIGFDRYMDRKWEDDALLAPAMLDFFCSADHVVANVGGIDMVALGSDFDGIDDNLNFKDYAGLPQVVDAIEKEFGAAACDKICHGNALRLFKEVIG